MLRQSVIDTVPITACTCNNLHITFGGWFVCKYMNMAGSRAEFAGIKGRGRGMCAVKAKFHYV